MYYIDQSIKIENTNKTTHVAISNGSTHIVSITGKDKSRLKLLFRQLQKPLVFKLFTFSVLVAKVIEMLKIDHVMVDVEYPGHEIDIKNYVTQLLLIAKKPVPAIHFVQIGKSNSAHIAVYGAYKKKKTGIRISQIEVIEKYERISK